jgi:hypothetical protein
LAAIQAIQIPRQAALRSVEGARAAHDDMLEVGRRAAAQRGFERLVSGDIDQADA